jgi:hypothetical protein
LKRLPVSMLKIDQSFVCGMLESEAAIWKGWVGLAVAFGREVIAEGVETLEHGEMLLQQARATARRPMKGQDIRVGGQLKRMRLDRPRRAGDLAVLFAGAETLLGRPVDRHFVGKGELPLVSSHHHCRFGTLDCRVPPAPRRPSLRAIRPPPEVHALGQSVCEHARPAGSPGLEHDRPPSASR